ncbi:hypothetical protein RZS08_07040, partial [Arthrospira platensis SPKY1]|nr:hypothetical protein [Arthrospira platensis SPKY1]
ESELREQRTLRKSNELAHNFAFTLFDRGIARSASGFQNLLETKGVSPEEIQPFSVDEVRNRDLPANLLESAFALTDNRYYTGAAQLNGYFGVLLLDGRTESYIPELAAVRD